MEIERIILDVDEVLADFVTGACRAHNAIPSSVAAKRRKTNTYWLHLLWELTLDEFWNPIDRLGSDFWQNLERLPWMDDVLKVCEDTRLEIQMATCPNSTTECLLGKAQWVENELSEIYHGCVTYTRHKHLLACSSSLLIDDSPYNVAAFRKHGGSAILFPTDGNHLHPLLNDPVTYLRKELNLYL